MRAAMLTQLTAWNNAYDEWEGARNDALAADAAMGIACGVAVWTAGGGGFTAAAYHVAEQRYSDCLAKLRP